MTDLVLLRYCDHSRFTIRNPLNWFIQYQIEQWMTSTDFDGDKRITFEEFKFSAAGNSLIDLEPWCGSSRTDWRLFMDWLMMICIILILLTGDWWHARTTTSQHPPATCVLNYKPLSQKSVCCPVSFHIIDILNCRAQFPCLIYKSNIKFQG